MKLTNTIRDAFVRAAMNDVPEIDYREQFKRAALAAAVDLLPPEVRAVWDKPELRPYLVQAYFWPTNAPALALHVPGIESEAHDQQLEAATSEIAKAHAAQQQQREELRQKLKACAYAATTRKALANMLPEFERYLPADEAAACKTLPAVANVVADFVKAGWPKTA